MASFADTVKLAQTPAMLQSRAGHMTSASNVPSGVVQDGMAQPSPNGNSVSIEEEMMNAINISREHNRALAIYKHGMTILRSSLGR
jgi:flagellar basal-body rod protein FlgB